MVPTAGEGFISLQKERALSMCPSLRKSLESSCAPPGPCLAPRVAEPKAERILPMDRLFVVLRDTALKAAP